MKLDFLIPGSPNDAFYSQIAFFRVCLDALGGDYLDARLVAVFGDTKVSPLPSAWRSFYRNIEVEWASPLDFAEVGFMAQSDRRFELVREDCDLAILCDADVALLGPFDGLLKSAPYSAALPGVIAHYHFPWPGRRGDPDVDWAELASLVLGRPIERPYRYTLHDESAPAFAPFYVNYGVLAAHPGLLNRFIECDRDIRPRVVDVLGPWWAPQVSLALSCSALGMPTVALPMRYDFPMIRRPTSSIPTSFET